MIVASAIFNIQDVEKQRGDRGVSNGACRGIAVETGQSGPAIASADARGTTGRHVWRAPFRIFRARKVGSAK